jgi:hypothetical protein
MYDNDRMAFGEHLNASSNKGINEDISLVFLVEQNKKV